MREQKIQRCCDCDEPTDRCEDDALYWTDGYGPLCETCYEKYEGGWMCNACGQEIERDEPRAKDAYGEWEHLRCTLDRQDGDDLNNTIEIGD